MTTAGNRSRELVQQVLQAQWAEVGVRIAIDNEDARTFFGQTVSERRFPAMAMFAWVSSPENVPRTTLHTDHIPTEDNNWAGQNYTGFSNAAMDALIEADRGRVGPAAAGGAVALDPGDLCRGTAGAAALLPRQPLYPAVVAGGRHPHWPSGAFDPVGRGLAAGGVIRGRSARAAAGVRLPGEVPVFAGMTGKGQHPEPRTTAR